MAHPSPAATRREDLLLILDAMILQIETRDFLVAEQVRSILDRHDAGELEAEDVVTEIVELTETLTSIPEICRRGEPA